jgi:phage-related protein
MSKGTIIFYTSANGQKPVEDFLEHHLPIKTKTFRILSNIKEYGLISAVPHLKKLIGTPLWEIRILGKDSARILYFIQSKDTIVLLHGFIKKTQKTPPQEITIALKRYQDLLD